MASPVQESIIQAEYYDIMIIGHTGQGKSTTSDKLLIANQEGAQYTTDVNIVTDEAKKQLQCGDMTLWMTTTSDFEKEETRLKTLVAARADSNPHIKIQKIRTHLNQMTIIQERSIVKYFQTKSQTFGSLMYQDSLTKNA